MFRTCARWPAFLRPLLTGQKGEIKGRRKAGNEESGHEKKESEGEEESEVEE